MKRRYANKNKEGILIKRIENKYLNGYITYILFDNIEKPFIVNDSTKDICIRDNNYKWYGVYPDNGKYAITIMFNDKDNLIQYYFDISKEVGVENGMPYEDDLYLDLVITSDNKELVLDEDELLTAKEEGLITEEDVEEAYETLKFLEEKYVKN